MFKIIPGKKDIGAQIFCNIKKINTKNLSKIIRDELKKVTVSIQGESLRVTGKNKDDLQQAISILRREEDQFDVPLQFENYR